MCIYLHVGCKNIEHVLHAHDHGIDPPHSPDVSARLFQDAFSSRRLKVDAASECVTDISVYCACIGTTLGVAAGASGGGGVAARVTSDVARLAVASDAAGVEEGAEGSCASTWRTGDLTSPPPSSLLPTTGGVTSGVWVVSRRPRQERAGDQSGCPQMTFGHRGARCPPRQMPCGGGA